MRSLQKGAAAPTVPGMRTLSKPRRYAACLLVGAIAIFAGLLLTRPEPVSTRAKNAGADQLILTWVDGGDELQIDGAGYRAKAIADIRLGSNPIEQVRADERGRVRVRVPHRLITAGQPGLSVIVIGRSKFGTSRTLISAVPPQAPASGPFDWLSWTVAAVVLACSGFTVLRRRRRGPAAPAPGPTLSNRSS